MEEKVITSWPMRLRLIDIEYKDLDEDEMIEQIKRIYMEEYGKELSANIFHSHESINLKKCYRIFKSRLGIFTRAALN
ncbi:hypothetical protein CFK40_14230 [Virgibacillus necropolis]|uniref:DUF6792 domain-containing protein n=2 Tax=Virgibacillus necropolis TaxID=163877 RepID=A0A221MEP4_9BACI|nr:hypothetical protein CFK40_14230 [Virgibacillus necropolis]